MNLKEELMKVGKNGDEIRLNKKEKENRKSRKGSPNSLKSPLVTNNKWCNSVYKRKRLLRSVFINDPQKW